MPNSQRRNHFMEKASLILPLILILSAEVKAQSPITPSPRPKFKIGYVIDGNIGVGCSLSLNIADRRERRYVFVQGMDEPAYINLDGENLKLELVDYSDVKNVPEKVGDRSWEIYVAGDVKVRIDRTVTWVCDPKDESCETTYYKAVMTITRKTQRAIIKTVGLCGG